jgi:hypothetical protein
VLLAHPDGGGHTLSEILEAEAKTARTAGIVHGGFILISVLLIMCLAAFSRILGFANKLVTLAFVLFCVGAAALMMSMTLDGLVIPALATQCFRENSPECLTSARTLFLFSGILISILMKMGLLFEGASMFLYSIAIVRRGAKAVGSYGIAAALILLISTLMVSGINPHLLIGGILLLCVWYFALAILLWNFPSLEISAARAP